MDNQHKLIKGYRDLTAVDIDLINRLKEKEAELLAFLNSTHDPHTHNPRSLALARTNVQQGFMWAIRAVARPNGE